MQLKISSSSKLIFEGDVKQVILPTDIGDVSILPGHNPVVVALKPGIIKITANDKSLNNNFVTTKGEIAISVSKGMAFVDGQIVKVITAVATTTPNESEKELENQKRKIEENIRELRKKGSLEEIEKSMMLLGKINADLKLKKLHS